MTGSGMSPHAQEEAGRALVGADGPTMRESDMRVFLKAAAAGAVLLSAQTAWAENWDLPAAYPANNYHTEILQSFADQVAEQHGGALTITVQTRKRVVQGKRVAVNVK